MTYKTIPNNGPAVSFEFECHSKEVDILHSELGRQMKSVNLDEGMFGWDAHFSLEDIKPIDGGFAVPTTVSCPNTSVQSMVEEGVYEELGFKRIEPPCLESPKPAPSDPGLAI
jgi:hypothetical protein